MMKKLFFAFLISLFLYSCTEPLQEKGFVITGNIMGVDSGMVFLKNRVDGKWVDKDSTVITSQGFELKGLLEAPEMLYLQVDGVRRFIPVYLENSEVTVEAHVDSIQNAVVSGSKVMDEYNAYLDAYKVITDKYDTLNKEYREAREAENTERMEFLDKKYDEVAEEEEEFLHTYIKEHNTSYVAPFLVYRYSYKIELEDLKELTASHDPSVNNSPYVTINSERIATLERVAIGQPAVDFTMSDTSGVEVSLSSFKGKYLLVDFWASWCGPCRRENPNVVACYNDFKDKNFDILGVSFDTSKDKWLEAIKEDNLTWNHVSDLEGWGNAAGKLYGVRSIPASVLLDPDGLIIEKNLRGEDLRNKLEELLND